MFLKIESLFPETFLPMLPVLFQVSAKTGLCCLDYQREGEVNVMVPFVIVLDKPTIPLPG